MAAKHFPFSLSKEDPAYAILRKARGNRSQLIRDAIEFHHKYGKEPVAEALAVYKAGGGNELIQRISALIEEKLAQAVTPVKGGDPQPSVDMDSLDELLQQVNEEW